MILCPMPRHSSRQARPEPGYVLCGWQVAGASGPPSWTGCLGRLREDLCELAELLAVLDELVVAPAPQDGNDRRAARTDAPAPCRLDVLDLCDPRSDTPALLAVDSWARLVAQERRAASLPGTAAGRAAWLAGQVEWLARHEAADEAASELGQARRWVAQAAGLGPRPPLFACPVVWPDGGEMRECGGPVVPMAWAFGARCARCGSQWDGEQEMRRLGLVRQS